MRESVFDHQRLGRRTDPHSPACRRTSRPSAGLFQGACSSHCACLSPFRPSSPRPSSNSSTSIRTPIVLSGGRVGRAGLAWIHPFGDGNGRTARLLEYQILLSARVPAASAHLLSNHYNLTRTEYYRQLDLASKSGGDVVPFVMYAVRGFLDGLQEQIDLVREQHLDITWRNYVHEFFKDKPSAMHTRRRHLVLDLSRHPEPVPFAGIPEISARLGRAYASRTSKTLVRDLNAMRNEGLLVQTNDGYRARKELIQAFLPQRAKDTASES